MQNKTILLVEDNPDDVEFTIRTLGRYRVTNQVHVARDGAEALDYLLATGEHAGRDTSVTPAVILLDLQLPKIDGLEVLKRIRADERTKRIPVVILTSSQEDEDLLNGYKLGCNSFVRKPVGFEGFCEAVRQVGLYWLILNEPPPNGGNA
jgi:two-component system response regulator